MRTHLFTHLKEHTMLEGGEVFYALDVTANLVHRQMMQTKQFNLRTNNSI